jgi:hypothetical protein
MSLVNEINKESYETALKEVRADAVHMNYMLIELSYDKEIVLPYKDGQVFVSTLSKAEVLETGYNKPARITPVERSNIKISLMSHTEYEQHKIAALLNISVQQVKDFAEQKTSG